MRPKIGNAVPTGHTENDESNYEIRDRTRKRVDEMANSKAFPIYRKCERITAVGNRAELDDHPKDTALEQLFADPNNDLKDVEFQSARGQRMTEFVRNRSENSKNVKQKERQQQEPPLRLRGREHDTECAQTNIRPQKDAFVGFVSPLPARRTELPDRVRFALECLVQLRGNTASVASG